MLPVALDLCATALSGFTSSGSRSCSSRPCIDFKFPSTRVNRLEHTSTADCGGRHFFVRSDVQRTSRFYRILYVEKVEIWLLVNHGKRSSLIPSTSTAKILSNLQLPQWLETGPAVEQFLWFLCHKLHRLKSWCLNIVWAYAISQNVETKLMARGRAQ